MEPPRVYLITDRSLVPDPAQRLEAALRGLPSGAVAVQLRERGLATGPLLALARSLRVVCHAAGQRLLVNDRVDGALIGVSCHGDEDVRRASDGGASFATFGPVYDTPSKRTYGAPVGLAALEAAAKRGFPLVALGGVTVENAPLAFAAGAHGVAAIRAWLEAPDPAEVVRAFLRAAGVRLP